MTITELIHTYFPEMEVTETDGTFTFIHNGVNVQVRKPGKTYEIQYGVDKISTLGLETFLKNLKNKS